MTVAVQNWICLWLVLPFAMVSIIVASRIATHAQKRLASFNERDPVIDALAWINRYTSWRPR